MEIKSLNRLFYALLVLIFGNAGNRTCDAERYAVLEWHGVARRELPMNSKLFLAAASMIAPAVPSIAAGSQDGAPQTSPQFPGVAYVESFGDNGGDFRELLFGSGATDVAPVEQYFSSGGFVNNDFSIEYAIDYSADLYTIDTSTGMTTLIGAMPQNNWLPYGPRWNPHTGLSYVTWRDNGCASTGLYTIDLSSAAMTLVGKSATCLAAIAIDPATGTMYAFDLLTENLVAVDQSTGAVQYVASLSLNDVDAMDFDPANGLLYIIGANNAPPYRVLYAYVPGTGLQTVGDFDTEFFGGFAFATRDGFFNGFETFGFQLQPERR